MSHRSNSLQSSKCRLSPVKMTSVKFSQSEWSSARRCKKLRARRQESASERGREKKPNKQKHSDCDKVSFERIHCDSPDGSSKSFSQWFVGHSLCACQRTNVGHFGKAFVGANDHALNVNTPRDKWIDLVWYSSVSAPGSLLIAVTVCEWCVVRAASRNSLNNILIE